MNLDKLREKLQDRRLSVISKATNIHVTTISRVRDKQVIPYIRHSKSWPGILRPTREPPH